MRRPATCGDANTLKMTTPNQQNHETDCKSRMDQFRKLLSSPLSRSKTFGVPLGVLVERNSSESSVPFVVNRLCQFILENGLKQEGIFRIEGNARLTNKLKTAFDQAGDALLETEGDVPSVASLLKLFLQELPEPVVPASLCPEFLNAVRACGTWREECARRLKCLLENMPFENFNLLKYLSQFLQKVARYENQNKMGPLALAVVFGPNIFRIFDDMKGIKDQSVTTQLIEYFITDCYEIFEVDSEVCFPKTTCSWQDKQPLEIKSSNPLFSTDSEKSKTLSISTPLGSPVALEPLSIVIPPLETYVAQEKQIHALFVDRIVENAMNHRVAKYVFGDQVRESQIVHLSHKRKHKEHGQLGDKPKSPRSNSEERILDWGSRSEDMISIRRCSSHEEIAYRISSGNVQDKIDHKKVHDIADQEKQITDLSPHPPHAKRWDVSNYRTCDLPVEVGSQPNESSQQQVANDVHEARRTIERLAPFHRSSVGKAWHFSSRASYRSLDLDSNGQTRTEGKGINYTIPDELTTGVNLLLDGDFPLVQSDCVICKENVHFEKVCRDKHETLEYSKVCDFCSMSGNNFTDSGAHHTMKDQPHFHILDKPSNNHYYHHCRGSNTYHIEGCLSHPMLELHPMESYYFEQGGEEQKNGSPGENNMPKDASPLVDFTSLYESSDETEPVLSEHRHSWPLVRPGREDTAALSPSFHYLQNLQVDSSLPLSSPVEQDVFRKSPRKWQEEMVTVKQVNKKIHMLKKKIRTFEEIFELEHGFRPSHAEKMNYTEIKNLLIKLNNARKDLKYLKREHHLDHAEGVARFHMENEIISKEWNDYKEMERNNICEEKLYKPTLEESLQVVLKDLSEERQLALRPDAIEEMSKEQVMDEKVSLQKALLGFESIHGRPTPTSGRELVRPLYERYRTLKRLVTRNSLLGGKGKDAGYELQPILEHVAMDFISPQPQEEGMQEEEPTCVPVIENHVPSADPETDLRVTKEVPTDLNITEQGVTKQSKPDVLPKYDSSNLHELPLSELLHQQHQTRTEKRRLRRVLRAFEDDFLKQNGRKVQKEDRNTMESVYGEYKHIKARLRLLEALVSKHEYQKI
ncbi:protein FAM13A-like isoform X3 [Tachypleus tridentatus]|uniref:protein FAM13A-like isoform X3 n=1 Tax=Tachypleus tridentatus TaxID=6853 RepID=UPI003FD38967